MPGIVKSQVNGQKGLEIAPPAWKTALPDWESRLLAGLPLVPALPLYKPAAARGLRVFKRLRIPDVIGTPSFGDAGGPWLFAIVEALFGSLGPDNVRSISEFFLLIPKKNSKSTAAAGIMVAAILINKRPDAEFNFLAPTIEVAGISFRQARGIIRLDKTLNDIFHVQDNIRRVTHRKSGAFLQIKAADSDVITGGKPVGTLIDETHLFSTKAKAAELFIEMRGALAARRDGFLLQITTQSKDPPRGVFKAELARARDVRDGLLQLPRPLLPILYELPRECDWRDERYWDKVNPNLGRSVDLAFLRSSLISAEREGANAIALLASQHFNVEIGQALRSDRWPGVEYWDQQADSSLTLDKVVEECDAVCVGIDGGGLDDTFGLAVVGRQRETHTWLCWSHAWCHRGVLDRRKSIAQTLLDFEAAGELTIVDDKLTDVSEMVDIVRVVKERDVLVACCVDPAGIGDFVDGLAEIGVTPDRKNLVGVPQGWPLMTAIKNCERKLASGALKHSGSSLMSWYCANLRIEPTATAIRATKQNAGDLKIDGAIALFNAATVLWQAKQAPSYQMIFA
jgi:phage terminase large subunit-like protein